VFIGYGDDYTKGINKMNNKFLTGLWLTIATITFVGSFFVSGELETRAIVGFWAALIISIIYDTAKE